MSAAKTTTATSQKTTAAIVAEAQSPEESRQVAVFQQPRLPYHPGIKDRFNIEPSGWKALVEAIYPSAKTVDAVVMALSYCKARNLDPFKRPVHIVPMWSAKGGTDGRGGYVETVWPGIAELRTTAARTGNYAGCDEAQFGPPLDMTFKGKVKVGYGNNAEWQTKEVNVVFPEWCRITVHRILNGRVCTFVGPKVLWLESYATIGKSDLPNDMWETRPEGQLEKCAEAAALRRAFPEEMGNDLTVDEMAGRVINDDAEPVEHARTTSAGPPPPDTVKGGNPAATQPQPTQAARQEDVIDVEHEEVEAMPPDENPAPPQTPAQTGTGAQRPTMITMDERDWLNELSGAFSGCEDLQTFADKQKKMMSNQRGKVTAEAWARAQHLAEDAYKRISANG